MGFFKRENPKKGFSYSVVIEIAPQRYIEIKIPENQPDRVDIGAAFKFHPAHLTQLQGLPPEQKKEFYYRIRRDINYLPVTFILLPPGKPINEVGGMGIIHTTYEDGLTKAAFAQAINTVNRAMFTIILEIEYVLGPLPSNTSDSSQDFI